MSKPAMTTIRQLFDRPAIAVLPGIYDGLSARLVANLGFEGGIITGAGLANSLLGLPDIGLLHPEAILRACRNIAQIVDIPLLADGNTGFGNAVNTYFATREFESTGVSAVFFEDQSWPKRCGHMPGKDLVSTKEMQQKVSAAVRARQSDDFLIIARTDAVGVEGLDSAIARGRSYVSSGADALFPDAIDTRESISKFVESVDVPVLINMGFGLRARSTTPLLSIEELQEVGASAVGYPRLITSAAVRGMQRALEELRLQLKETSVEARPDLMVSFEELTELVGIKQISALEQQLGMIGREQDRSE